MSRPTDTPQEPTSDDALLNRYREANAHDPSRPRAAVRAAVLAYARTQQAAADTPPQRQPAANDSQWKIRALGSLAVLGFVGLLVMQFERGTPEEQATALGAPSLPGRVASAPAATASAPLPSAAQAPAANTAPPSPASPVPEPTPAPDQASAKTKPSEEQRAKKQASAPTPLADHTPAAELASPKPAPARAAQALPPARQTPTPPPPQETDALMGSATGDAAVAPPDSTSAEASAAAQRQRSVKRAEAPSKRPPLHEAVVQGDLPRLKRLLEQGVDMNSRDALGQTPLMVAAAGDNKAVLMALLEAGADVSLADPEGLTAANRAQQAGNHEWLPLLQPPAQPR